MSRLPWEHRQAILLREVNRLSYDEIARVVGVDREQVAARIRDARRALLATQVTARPEYKKRYQP